MVRRNPYKKKKEIREDKEGRNPERKKGKRKNKKKDERNLC